jgi:hypothetical protein
MLSTHECVNQIQHILSTGEPVAKEKVAELVWAYASACRRLNERAQKCLDFLRQGRRADALNLAKVPPDLQQELRLLDFPERSAWLDLCETAGLPIAQSLDTNALDAIIQETYSEGGTLDRLLKTFKRMSIGRAPLADRLRILRRIRRADPQPDLWLEDIRAFEAARQGELLNEAEEADGKGDLAALESLLAELRSGEWLAPPARLLATIEKITAPHRRRYATACFTQLAEDLHEAHGRMDEQQCRFLLGQWESVVRETGVQPDEAQAERVAPVREWVEGLDAARHEDEAFQAACAALETAIDDNEGRHILEHLAATVFRFERGMPELLAARFNSCMEELGRKSGRRFALTLAGVIGGVLILAGLVTAVIVWQSRSSERERWRGEIAGALEKGDLEGAGRMLAALAEKNPEVRSAPEIAALARQHERKVQEEAGRMEEFQGLQKKVEDAGPAAPDPKALAQAGELARTLPEKQWVEDWRQKYERAVEDALRQREDAFRLKLDELKALHAKFSEAEQAHREDLDAVAEPCLALAKELAAWTDVSKALQAEVGAIEKHVTQGLKAFAEAAGKRQAIREILDRLPSLTENPDELAKTLETFVQNYPEHPLSAHFSKAVSMAREWRAVNAWQLMVDAWQGQFLVVDVETARARNQQVQEYVKQHPGGPFESAAQDYKAYLSAAMSAFIDGRLIGIAKVNEVLNHPVFTDALQLIRTRNDRAYYILKKDLRPQRAGDRIVGYSFSHMISTLPSFSQGYVNLSVDKIQEGPVPAPQILFAKAAQGRLEQFQATGWETFYLELAAQAQAQKGVDPVLTGQMLQLLLGFASSTTPFHAEQIRQWTNQISGENLDFVAWLDPDNSEAVKARLRMEQILNSMGSLQVVIADIHKTIDAMSAAMRPYRPIGIVLNGSDPIQFGQTPPDGGAYVLVEKAREAPQFVEIGRVKGGKFSGEPAIVGACPQGSPVFTHVSK